MADESTRTTQDLALLKATEHALTLDPTFAGACLVILGTNGERGIQFDGNFNPAYMLEALEHAHAMLTNEVRRRGIADLSATHAAPRSTH